MSTRTACPELDVTGINVPLTIDEYVLSADDLDFLKNVLKVREDDTTNLVKVVTELRRVSGSCAGIGEVAHTIPAFREGHEDEYGAMINLATLKDFGYDTSKYAKNMPDIARCAGGLIAPPALQVKKSENGIICCDLGKLRQHLHQELGIVLVKGNRLGNPFSFRVPIFAHIRNHDDEVPPPPFLLDDPALVLRLLTAYRNHNAFSLPLFSDNPVIPADADPELVELFECCICHDIMKDPVSLGCGHSGCLRCMENVLKHKDSCPICREPDSGRPLCVTPVLRECISKLLPNVFTHNPEKTLSTRDLMVEKFSSPAKMAKEIWFADMSLSIAARRSAVLSGTSITMEQGVIAGPNALNDTIPEACLQRLLRRAGCLGEYMEVYDEIRGSIESLMEQIMIAIPHACRTAPQGVVCDDVLAALSKSQISSSCSYRMHPTSLYGFGGPHGFRYVWGRFIKSLLNQVHRDAGLCLGGGAASVICDMLSEMLHTLLTLAAEATDPYLKDGCQQVMECAAGHELDTGKLDSTYKVQIRVTKDRADSAPGSDTGSKAVLTVEDVVQSVVIALPGEIRNHALAEGHNAVSKLRASITRCGVSGGVAAGELHKSSGLRFHPQHVALFAQRTKVPIQLLDLEACVFLTAVVEYICAEIVEFAGNIALKNVLAVIDERSVALGVGGDLELSILFRGHIRNGGVVPNIHWQHAFEAAALDLFNPTPSAFDRSFAALVLNSPCAFDGFCVGIDPRDGLHYAFVQKKSNLIGVEAESMSNSGSEDASNREDVSSAIPLPQLDCCCATSIKCRQEAARDALPAEARSTLDAEKVMLQSPRRAAEEIVRRIRLEQSLTDYCMDPLAFRYLVHATCNRLTGKMAKKFALQTGREHSAADSSTPETSKSGGVWSGEALQALQAIAEAHVLRLCSQAQLEALHAGRVLLLPADLRRAQGLDC